MTLNLNIHEDDQQLLFDVIIVGAGVAGCSAAYHLLLAGVRNILVLDAAPSAGTGVAPRSSGSATMASALCIKMMVQVCAGSCAEFGRHHGQDGLTSYLNAAREGLVLQKRIAREIWKDDAHMHIKEMGSFYLAYEHQEGELKREFEILKQFGCYQDGIEWCDKDRLASVEGMSPKFHCGIFFPNDAAIDSSLYSKTLIDFVLEKSGGKAQFWPNTPVSHVTQTDQGTATIHLKSGNTLQAKYVVVATGALHAHAPLNGIAMPCYSYLVHVPTDGAAPCQDSANFFTWGFTHDWCYTSGKIRTSGEDHFNAYKPPRMEERCANLRRWTLEQYCCNVDEQDTNYPRQYGLYSETPDMAPLVGAVGGVERVCYLLGCNAWGQSILSYCSSLVPGLLGYTSLTETQKNALRVVSIKRFSEVQSRL